MEEELLQERDWLADVLDDFSDLEITDRGIGMGTAEIVYQRDAGEGQRRDVELQIRILPD